MVALKQQGRLIIFFAMLVLLSSCSGGGGDFAISSTSSEISQISATGGSVIEEREESSVNHEEQDSDGYSDWTGYTGYSDGGRNFTVKETAKRGIAAGKRLLCSLQMIFSILFEVIHT